MRSRSRMTPRSARDPGLPSSPVGMRGPPTLALQRLVGNRATGAVLARAAAGVRVLARGPADDQKRAEEVARGDRVHDRAMDFLEGKMRELYKLLPANERQKLRASAGDDTIAIGMIVEAGDPKERRPRLVYTTANNRASAELKAAADKLGLTRWEVDPNVRKPAAKKDRPPPRIHGPGDGPPELTGGLEHAEQLMELEAENERVRLRAIVVSRTPCHDCQVALNGVDGGRVTVSYVPDVPDEAAPKQPNKRTERWEQKKKPQQQGDKPGTGPEHDPGDEDDGGRRRTEPPEPAGGHSGGEGGKPPPEPVKPAPTPEPVTPAPAPEPPRPAPEPVTPPDPDTIARGQASQAANELLEFDRGTKQLEFMTDTIHLGLGVWNVVTWVEQYAAAMQMAAATLADGSPYAKAIKSAQGALKSAQQVRDYYFKLDLRAAMPSKETDPLDWNSQYELYQKQITFLGIEAHIYAARKSIDGAIDELRDRYRDLKKGMDDREEALLMPITSLAYAEAFLYADAGGKINQLILQAVAAYTDANRYALQEDGMAEAALKWLEVRLRELGGQGLFGDIDTDDLHGAKLDKFNQREL